MRGAVRGAADARACSAYSSAVMRGGAIIFHYFRLPLLMLYAIAFDSAMLRFISLLRHFS
jgi:hypothetical protein